MAKRKTKLKRNNFISIIVIIIAIIGLIPTLGEKYLGFGWNDIFRETEIVSSANIDEYPVSVHFIDVKQGDCELITSSFGNVLIDSGETDQKNKVLNYLDRYNIKKLDYVIASHPHSDHIGCMSYIIDKYDVGKFLTSEIDENDVPTSKCYERLLDSLIAKDVKSEYCKAGDKFKLGDISFTVVAPVETITNNLNSMSVVLKMEYKDFSVLFTGDCEKDEENTILDSGADLKCDILKVGHHGSKTSSSTKFLNAVNPQISVISLGTGNEYGHPHKSTIENLKKYNTDIYRTDKKGDIVLSSDGDKIYTYFEKE